MNLAHTYRYPRPSLVEARPQGFGCTLIGDRDALFRGQVTAPRTTALFLRTLARTVAARFFLPANVRLPLLDPVVTIGRSQVRFEGFSGCCSTYARVDLGDDAFVEVAARTPGTTNVDFRAPMRAALAKVRDGSPLLLEVGREAVAIDTGEDQVIERKVALPLRWLKGLGEAQVFLSRMQPTFAASRAEATRFVRSLPRTTRHATFVEPVGRALRVSQQQRPGAVRVHGVERLKLLEDLLPRLDTLEVSAEPSGASAWRATCGTGSLTVVLSPERWRGFSGEGQLLASLARRGDAAEAMLTQLRAQLRWQDDLDAAALAAEHGVEADTAHDALALLASRGLLGFDPARGRWFHRDLPFDLEQVEALHPRLLDARKLVDAGAVQLADDGTATVRSGDTDYRVVTGEAPTCTCPWFAQHRGERGPCKHVLAATLVAESN